MSVTSPRIGVLAATSVLLIGGNAHPHVRPSKTRRLRANWADLGTGVGINLGITVGLIWSLLCGSILMGIVLWPSIGVGGGLIASGAFEGRSAAGGWGLSWTEHRKLVRVASLCGAAEALFLISLLSVL